MLKFFRKFRQGLFFGTHNRSSGSTVSKYILYALGEILLIVIGILLALQLNNWNEERKTRKLEKFTLSELKNALDEDQESLASVLFLYEKINSVATSITDRFKQTQQLSKSDIDSLGYFIGLPAFQFNLAGYKLAEDRGLDLISNNELRNSITTYYENQIRMTEYYFSSSEDYNKSWIDWIQQHFYPVAGEGYSPDLKPYDYEALGDHQKIIGNLNHYANSLKWMIGQLKRCQKLSKEIIDKIEAEIN